MAVLINPKVGSLQRRFINHRFSANGLTDTTFGGDTQALQTDTWSWFRALTWILSTVWLVLAFFLVWDFGLLVGIVTLPLTLFAVVFSLLILRVDKSRNKLWIYSGSAPTASMILSLAEAIRGYNSNKVIGSGDKKGIASLDDKSVYRHAWKVAGDVERLRTLYGTGRNSVQILEKTTHTVRGEIEKLEQAVNHLTDAVIYANIDDIEDDYIDPTVFENMQQQARVRLNTRLELHKDKHE